MHSNWVIPFKYDVGSVLKDIVTGFKGVVMARTQYFTGCNHYGLLSQKLNKDSKPMDYEWFDETRLVQIKPGLILMSKNKPTSGPHPNAPKM